jgi:hypothetical protein
MKRCVARLAARHFRSLPDHPPFPRAKSEPDVGRYGVCSRPHSTLNSRKQTGLLKGFNIGMNATILAPKRASE